MKLHVDRDIQFVRSLSAAPVLPYTPEPVSVLAHTPWNPSAQVQQKFVGATFNGAYEEASAFVAQALQWSGGSLDQGSPVLDFGSGWGRISRFLLAHVPPTHVYCLDVDPDMTALVNATLPGVNALTGTPLPPTVFADGTFATATAFSVFSHLSEDAHIAWAGEFGRIISSGGLAFITVLDESFLDKVAACQTARAAGGTDPFTLSLADLFADIDQERNRFKLGEFVYGDPGPDGPRTGDFYGWAAAPDVWIRDTWRKAGFEIVHSIPSGILFKQAILCLRRR